MKQYEREWLDRLDAIIENNIPNPDFQLSDITTKLKVSRAKLYRMVTKLTKASPSEYLRNKRLKKAYEMLDKGVYPTIKETSAAVGFRQPEHFTRTFYKEYEILPSDLLNK
ncbi:MAG: helix-turn-helix domain-containing protein [Saprospiraceae bacterium]